MVSPRIPALLVSVAAALSVTACANASASDDSVPLLRASSAPAMPSFKQSGRLDAKTGCLRFVAEDRSEHSLIFMDPVGISTDGDQLVISGTSYGPVRDVNLSVTLDLQDGPVTYTGSGVAGPTDRVCNQTAPFYVKSIQVVG